MRKLALICAALVIAGAALPAAAQDEAKNRFGFVAGFNASQITGYVPDIPNLGSYTVSRRNGLAIGGVYEHSLGAFGFLRIEPKYIQKGGDIEVGVYAGNRLVTSSGQLALDYIDVPIMLRAVYFKRKPWAVKPLVQVGVGPNFLLKAKFEGHDVKSDFKSVEWGLTSAFGITGKIGNAEWTADFRFVSSLSRIDDGAPDKVKNSGMGGTLSFTFPFGK
jgi:hypothetical protein